MDKKEELIAYFKDEIRDVSTKEIEALKKEIEEIQFHTLKEIQERASAETKVLYEQELYEMDSEHAIALSHLSDENNRKLMMERESLVEQIFQEARMKMIAFTKSDAYETLLKRKLNVLKDKNLTPATLYVRKEDEGMLEHLLKAYELPCEGCVSSEIQLGGFQIQCTAKGICVDESFDQALEQSKQWFYNTSGFTIR